MQATPRQLEVSRLRTKLDMILEKYQELDLNEDAPFVIYLTERMLSDIEACRQEHAREQRLYEIRQRATWPSLN
ncbi:MAG TPA: hypothetical protein PKA06_09490 [Gemmatales bacterium]|nr:hypothetical protein [Gemmatales bacterium]HMP17503.1 hypothetical protein [Gemmatales bacterium]